jgi:NAD(P)H-nitrite reductase large subunit
MEREATMRYVIIGNGVAGVHAAEIIRRFDPNGAITLISDEVSPPYCRPMISMVLEETVPAEKLPIRSSSFYEDLRLMRYSVTAFQPSMWTIAAFPSTARPILMTDF